MNLQLGLGLFINLFEVFRLSFRQGFEPYRFTFFSSSFFCLNFFLQFSAFEIKELLIQLLYEA